MTCQRLLVVDDDRSHSAAVAAILAPLGYEIDTAQEGRAAMHLIERLHFGLAILDFQMPEMDGVELFHHIREVQPQIKGVLLTAYTTIDKVFPAIESGIERVLAKPVNAGELISLVKQLLGAAEAQKPAP